MRRQPWSQGKLLDGQLSTKSRRRIQEISAVSRPPWHRKLGRGGAGCDCEPRILDVQKTVLQLRGSLHRVLFLFSRRWPAWLGHWKWHSGLVRVLSPDFSCIEVLILSLGVTHIHHYPSACSRTDFAHGCDEYGVVGRAVGPWAMGVVVWARFVFGAISEPPLPKRRWCQHTTVLEACSGLSRGCDGEYL